MNPDYAFIQTVRNIDANVSSYSIQPIRQDEAASVPQEDPILGFGPLGKINIFVGATNAGKSRFLRTLAKCQSYAWLPSEQVHKQMWMLQTAIHYLAQSDQYLSFEVTFGAHKWQSPTGGAHTGRSPFDAYWPGWASRITNYFNYQTNFKEQYDANFFQLIEQRLIPFLAEQLSFGGAKPVSSASRFELGDEFDHVGIAAALLPGEINARKADADTGTINRDQYGRLLHQSLLNMLSKVPSPYSDLFRFDYSNTNVEWQKAFLQFADMIAALLGNVPSLEEVKPVRFYIPTLRSAVSLHDDKGIRLTYDVFENTVRKNYHLDDMSLKIFTGNRLYDTMKIDRNGTPDVIVRLRSFERFLSNAFFEGRIVEIVPQDEAYGAQHISVRVQGETPRDLHDLGDGINTLVILLYQLFMAEPRSWIFIEEPELNLHPGLQRVFLQTLMENEDLQERDLTVFFTTHSNHLLRMTLRDGTIATRDISIFAFQQRVSTKDHFLIRPLVSEHHEALALLGVQNASVLLAQCGIWVEGITDRQYLRAYLNAYQESDEFRTAKMQVLREDTHYAFWEYSGSNLAHYLMRDVPTSGTPEAEDYDRGKKEILAEIESSALCNRIFLLADQDKNKEEKHAALTAIAEGRSNFAYFVLPCIEIENMLSPTELKLSLPHFLKKKNEVFEVSFKQEDYKEVRMGTFLLEKFSVYVPTTWVENSGTLATVQKNRLCKYTVKQIRWDTMSEEAKDLTETLYNFLLKHNQI
ncbi:MAG: AAA family ATPase [Abitibacteriaceae bacterium]|nr:AAA family ATPase [Abditibacteriaceae bacterium]